MSLCLSTTANSAKNFVGGYFRRHSNRNGWIPTNLSIRFKVCILFYFNFHDKTEPKTVLEKFLRNENSICSWGVKHSLYFTTFVVFIAALEITKNRKNTHIHTDVLTRSLSYIFRISNWYFLVQNKTLISIRSITTCCDSWTKHVPLTDSKRKWKIKIKSEWRRKKNFFHLFLFYNSTKWSYFVCLYCSFCSGFISEQ